MLQYASTPVRDAVDISGFYVLICGVRHQYPIVAFVFVVPASYCVPSGAEAASVPAPRVVETLNKVPLAFEKNQGQTLQSVEFLARGAGYSVFLSRGNARVALRHDKSAAPVAVDLRLLGASRNPKVATRVALPGHVNYFLGNDPARWRTDVPTFGRVEYSSVYRGIDLAYYGNQGRLEYDFIVAPGAHPDAIRLTVDGARNVHVSDGGDLVLETEGGPVAFRKPVTYQEIAGVRRPVESRYVLAGAREVRFAVGAYDSRHPMVIDPSLVYSTYLGDASGGSGPNTAIAVDSSGNAYVTGTVSLPDYPLVNAEQSFYTGNSAIFVSKLAPDGSSLIYSTYLGGSGLDNSRAIAVDSTGSAYVAGQTQSTDFPVQNAIYSTLKGSQDAFVTKFSASGSALVYSTYLGGSGTDSAYGVAVDTIFDVYLAGQTNSPDFPVTSKAYQASANGSCSFVTKLNPGGTALLWSTYFGQNCSAGAAAIAVDAHRGVYLTGNAVSGLPVTAGAPQPVFGGGLTDAFAAKLISTGVSLAYCTYLGGSQIDSGTAIAVDAGDNAYVAGYTQSPDLPVTASAIQPAYGGNQDAFVAKLNSTGTAWSYLTYLGGLRADQANGIAVDSSGNATVVGSTSSTNFPRVAALQPSLAGNQVPIYKTTNGGASWKASATGFNGDANYLFNAIVIDPASDSHLLAVSGEGLLYESSDSGASWAPNSFFSQGGATVATVAFSPAGGTVYAGGGTAVYSSSDSGATWGPAGTVPPPMFPPWWCDIMNLAVDPNSPSTLYMGGGTIYWGVNYAAKSTDGGATWADLSGLPVDATVTAFAINPKSSNTVYAASTFWNGEGGLFKSTDTGTTWPPLSIAGLQNPNVTAVVINPSQPAVVYAVANGSVYKSTNSGSSWALASTGLTDYAFQLAIAPSNPAVLYAATLLGVFVSSNGAASWKPAGLVQDLIWGLAVDLASPGVVYAMSDDRPDGFVAKINPAGTKLLYSTYLGGTNADYAYGVALNSSGDALVTGGTISPDFPFTPGALQPVTGFPRLEQWSTFVTRIRSTTPACSYSPAPAAYILYPAGGLADFSVVAPSGCAWTATPSASWITVIRGAGPGVAPLAVSVAANTGAARSGTITIGSASISISQAASGCTYSLSTNSLSFPQSGGSQSVNVTAGAGCPWTVMELPLWLTVTSGVSGTGDGTVTLAAAPNLFPRTRSVMPPTEEVGAPGAINIANQSVSVSQGGTSGSSSRR